MGTRQPKLFRRVQRTEQQEKIIGFRGTDNKSKKGPCKSMWGEIKVFLDFR